MDGLSGKQTGWCNEPVAPEARGKTLDQLNGMLILDDALYVKLQRLAPHLGILDLKKPRALSRNGKVPAPVMTTVSAWVHEGR